MFADKDHRQSKIGILHVGHGNEDMIYNRIHSRHYGIVGQNAIEFLLEFEIPVIAKKDGKGIFEKITNNRWGNVRRIPKDVALSIISNGSKKYSYLKKVNPPELLVENKINNFKNNINDDNELNVFSKRAKLIGDLGESYVFNFLKNKRVRNLRWLANENIKPGWDIEFLDEHNSLKCIEVKSTTKKYFSSIQITKNE